MNDDSYTIKSGFLNVSDGHQLYFQQWGNPKAKPTLYLHGGPGTGCKDRYKALFDPLKHHVIFHDQRGSGQSLPFADIEHNTTQHLIEDIESLRQEFGFKKVQIVGGSWGSALALAYAISYPDRVSRMLLWGIFTGTRAEIDYIQQGGLKTHFPESWEQYIEVVPKNKRDDTTNFYLDKFLHGTEVEKTEFTKRWVMLEASAMSVDPDLSSLAYTIDGSDETTRALAILEAHYFTNNCFLPNNFIYNNVDDVANIPITMIQGRFDHVCPPQTAYNLAKKLGANCHLQIVPAAHAREDSLRETIKSYMQRF